MHSKTLNQQNTPSLWKAESSCSEDRLLQIAEELAQQLKTQDRVFLEGPMGVGKSTFARALLSHLQIVQPPEGSPTFAIAHEYESSKGGVVHIDFYRIRSELEIDEAGIPSYFWERPLIVITEWLSSWPDFERQALKSGRTFQVYLEMDAGMDPGCELKRKIEIFSVGVES